LGDGDAAQPRGPIHEIDVTHAGNGVSPVAALGPEHGDRGTVQGGSR